MKFLYLVLLVAAARASILKAPEDIPAPNLVRLTSLDPPGFRVEWNPVKSKDEADPVVGYKVKVWEQESKKVINYQMIDGVNTLVEESILNQLPKDGIPDWEPTEMKIEGADTTAAQYENIKVGVMYEVRVQAFTKKFEGPMSRAMRIKLF